VFQSQGIRSILFARSKEEVQAQERRAPFKVGVSVRAAAAVQYAVSSEGQSSDLLFREYLAQERRIVYRNYACLLRREDADAALENIQACGLLRHLLDETPCEELDALVNHSVESCAELRLSCLATVKDQVPSLYDDAGVPSALAAERRARCRGYRAPPKLGAAYHQYFGNARRAVGIRRAHSTLRPDGLRSTVRKARRANSAALLPGK
jgi:hypothetical protein